jgi:hypothetical protein
MQGSKVDLTTLPEKITARIGGLYKNNSTGDIALVKTVAKINGRHYYKMEISDSTSESNGLILESFCEQFDKHWVEL